MLTVATSGTLFPSSYHDEETNELTGYETEVLREVAERLGVDIEFDEMGYDGILTSVLNGTADVAAGIDITEDRKETLLVDELNSIVEELRNEGILSELSKEFYDGQDISEPMAEFEDLPVVEVE